MRTINPCNCPNCNYWLTGHKAVIGDHLEPKPGDVSICIRCGAILEFGQGGSVTVIDIERATDIFEGRAEMLEPLLFISSAVRARYTKKELE